MTVWIRRYHVRATNKQERKKKCSHQYKINSIGIIINNFAWRGQVYNKNAWNKVLNFGILDIDMFEQIKETANIYKNLQNITDKHQK